MTTLNTTTNNGFRYPTSANNGTDFATGIADLAVDVDGMWAAGTLVARPAASSVKAGAVYRTTDSGKETLSSSDGSAWLPLGLIPASTSSSVTAVSGQAVITTGASAVTVTLPSHAAKQIVTVINQTSNTTTVSGSNIQGIGLSSASSFQLGAPGASATLLDDGTNWQIIAGQQDSGWVNYSVLNTAWANVGRTLQARLQGDVLRFRGGLENTSGVSQTGITIASWPSTPFAGLGNARLPSVNCWNSSGSSMVPVLLQWNPTSSPPVLSLDSIVGDAVPNNGELWLDGIVIDYS